MTPKVDENYINNKRNYILDKLLEISMQQRVHEISIRSLIKICEISPGSMYKYFSNIDDIYISLINRETTSIELKYEIDRLFDENSDPKTKLRNYMEILKKLIIEQILGIGKIYFELSYAYANDPRRLKKLLEECNISKEFQHAFERGHAFITSQIKNGYFQSTFSADDIFNFIITSVDGINRDLILNLYYNSDNSPMLDKDRLIGTLTEAVILLLNNKALIDK